MKYTLIVCNCEGWISVTHARKCEEKITFSFLEQLIHVCLHKILKENRENSGLLLFSLFLFIIKFAMIIDMPWDVYECDKKRFHFEENLNK